MVNLERGMRKNKRVYFSLKCIPETSFKHYEKHCSEVYRETKMRNVDRGRTKSNEVWHRGYNADESPKTLKSYYDGVISNYQKKYGQRMQEKGMCRIIGVAFVSIREDNSLEDLKRLGAALQNEFGWTCIQVHIHRDEKYSERSELYNLHAHLFFVLTNRSNYKSWKKGREDYKLMRELASQILGLEISDESEGIEQDGGNKSKTSKGMMERLKVFLKL